MVHLITCQCSVFAKEFPNGDFLALPCNNPSACHAGRMSFFPLLYLDFPLISLQHRKKSDSIWAECCILILVSRHFTETFPPHNPTLSPMKLSSSFSYFPQGSSQHPLICLHLSLSLASSPCHNNSSACLPSLHP